MCSSFTKFFFCKNSNCVCLRVLTSEQREQDSAIWPPQLTPSLQFESARPSRTHDVVIKTEAVMVPISTFFNIIQLINLTKKIRKFNVSCSSTYNNEYQFQTERIEKVWLIDCYESIFKEKVVLKMSLIYYGWSKNTQPIA